MSILEHLTSDQADQLERDLMAAFVKAFMIEHMKPGTPMNEARDRGGACGKYLGRALAATFFEGELSHDALMYMRRYEEEMKQRTVDSTSRLYGPGGFLRERLNERD